MQSLNEVMSQNIRRWLARMRADLAQDICELLDNSQFLDDKLFLSPIEPDARAVFGDPTFSMPAKGDWHVDMQGE